MNQSQDEYEINHRENVKWQETTDFLPRFTCLPTRYVPLCRPTLGGLAAKRCCTNLVHTIGHRKNLPTSEVTQWHEQSTRVTFRCSAGEGTNPLTITGDSHNNHQLMPILHRCTKPSRWWQPPRETSEIRSKTWIPSASRCNHSSNTLEFSPNLTKMMNQWWR